MTRKIKWEYLSLLCICAAYLGLTLYRLPELPGEWYGDISIEHQAVTAILSGHWPWQFNLSAGPAYHYIVAAFAYFLGANYATYKLASVVTGLVVILLTFLLGKEFGGVRAGLFAALAGAVSFWLILFARLGSSPQILSPVLSAGAVYFLLRFSRTRRWYDVAISMAFAGWGLFTYPSTFVLPVILLALILWQLIFMRDRALRWRAPWWRALAVAIAVLLPFAIGFGLTVKANSAFSQGGYVVGKIAEQHESPAAVALTFGKNMLKALGMFQWAGDHAFRTNVPGSPALDPLSGVLLDLGLVWLFISPRLRSRWGYVIAPFIILLMPSAAPGILPNEIPSASRALGVAPFAFLLVGLGVEAVWTAARKLIASKGRLPFHLPHLTRSDRSIPLTGGSLAPRLSVRANWASGVIIGLALVTIGYFNVHHYFNDYASQLPGHNQPWNQLIAQYIETLPAHTTVKMVTCCWQDTEQPSLQVVGYQLEGMKSQATLDTKAYIKSCQELKPGERYVIILPPREDSIWVRRLRDCFPYSARQMHYDGIGQPAFFTLSIDLRLSSQALP